MPTPAFPVAAIAAIEWQGDLGSIKNGQYQYQFLFSFPLEIHQYLLSILGLFHCVYYQGTNNYIYELSYNDSQGWQKDSRKLCDALPGMSMTAIVFLTGKSPEIHFYYFNPQGVLSEYCYSGGNWGTGSNIPAPDCATNCRLSSFVFGSNPDIRVYYQTWDNVLAETCSTKGGWRTGIRFA
jgi:hypothetical protein